MKTGELTFTARNLSQIIHGAGSSGNTTLIRTEKIWNPDEARVCSVPFISANSLKGVLRRAGSHYALEVMGIEPGSLSKPVIDLLFCGGHLTKGGGAVNVSAARDIGDLFPWLSVCGYSAGNTMERSKLMIDHIHLVCKENRWRMPEDLRDSPEAKTPSGQFRTDTFGVRHDPARDQTIMHYALPADSNTVHERMDANLQAKTPDKGDSAQMIYDSQAIASGALWWGAIHFQRMLPMEMAALQASLGALITTDTPGGGLEFPIAAKRAVGMGRMDAHFQGRLIAVDAPSYSDDSSLLPRRNEDATHPPSLTAYTEHLRLQKDQIMAAIKGMAT